MNALAKPEVGKYLNQHFVSSYQKVATFTLANGQKQGGNVASYFTTPDGKVLHLIAGPVDAATLLREARWVAEAWKMAQLQGHDKNPTRLKTFFQKAHVDRLKQERGIDLKKVTLPTFEATPQVLASVLDRAKVRQGRGRTLDNPGRVHVMLAHYPLVKLEQVYAPVFERLLNEQVSTLPVVQKG